MESTQINLERLFPEFLHEKWSLDKLASEAGCTEKTALRFVDGKRQEISAQTSAKVVGIARKTWNSLERRALIDRDTLDDLNTRQESGEEVSDKLVSSVVKRLIALINMGKSMTPYVAGPNEEARLVGGSLNRK